MIIASNCYPQIPESFGCPWKLLQHLSRRDRMVSENSSESGYRDYVSSSLESLLTIHTHSYQWCCQTPIHETLHDNYMSLDRGFGVFLVVTLIQARTFSGTWHHKKR